MRCPHCGGLNDLDAEWCMQCSRRLKPPRPRIDFDAGGPGVRETVAGALDVVAGEGYGDDEGLRRAFTLGEKKASWVCARCGYFNELKADVCADCGRPFTDTAAALAGVEVAKKQSRSVLKALGIVTVGAVVMRLVAGLISPWAAAAVLGGAILRFLVKYLRD